MTDKRVAIVGAGIAGLSLGLKLQDNNIPFSLFEASDRIGGRIYSPNGYDLGPAWFWPGQSRIAQLLKRLGLHFYIQQDEGSGLYQTPMGTQRLPSGYSSTSYRVEGGLGSVTAAMAEHIGKNNIFLEHPVNEITLLNNGLVDISTGGKRRDTSFTHVVLAMPPRLIQDSIDFLPALPVKFSEEMRNIPTWMAGNAKALVRYAKPFWHDQQLSGTAYSQIGPLVQIHDASLPEKTNGSALFGFLGNINEALRSDKTALIEAILQQLTDLFGSSAKHPTDVLIKDWRANRYVATKMDAHPLYEHPLYGLSETHYWKDSLIFIGTESVSDHGGLIEGALLSSENAWRTIAASK